jgi:chaperonin GroEL
VAIIHVGGNTETEMREKKDRVDDALNATKAAIEEGIVAGGGAALIYAREAIIKDNIGADLVYKACGRPFEQILTNAGYDLSAAKILSLKVAESRFTGNWHGYNLKTELVENLRDAGIIDPTKVTRTAIESAASVAGTILLTECVVVDDPDTKNEADPMAGMMNGMM